MNKTHENNSNENSYFQTIVAESKWNTSKNDDNLQYVPPFPLPLPASMTFF